ncbi:hypothetical protein BO71DRAFT_402689 [Aspergillus ellipticus CBS 707.79]|uniref:Uncharacterized protein n=1 Tax=Aspergillus ellipticus CBS 707.79 TaxID=1448320 RepID=A0A319DP93_9EURO|nr:hypothetical protein BO71DRAFT_402689 [Aspergillus ellipticus CBS 707.79]
MQHTAYRNRIQTTPAPDRSPQSIHPPIQPARQPTSHLPNPSINRTHRIPSTPPDPTYIR